MKAQTAVLPKSASGFAPVQVWAVLGFAILALNIYVYSAWIAGPYFKPVPIVGPDVPPEWTYVVAHVIETITITSFLASIYWIVLRPWRRSGEISADGLMVLAFVTLNWQNSAINFFAPTALLSPVFTNFGSWYSYIPGWVSPNAQLSPEAPMAWGFCYATWFAYFPMILGAKTMRWLQNRHPKLSALGIFLVVYAGFMVLDLVLEGAFLRTGMYVYAGTVHRFTLWAGEVYQFPIYEFILWGFCWALYSAIYFWRDDHGLTFAERGIETVRISRAGQKFLRFLALSAIFNLVFLIGDTVPVGLAGLHADPFPKGIPSYLLGGVCGPKTAYDCTRPDLPLATRTSTTNRVAEPIPPVP